MNLNPIPSSSMRGRQKDRQSDRSMPARVLPGGHRNSARALSRESVVGVRCLARVVFRAQSGRAYGSDHGQKLLECHLEIKESAWAEDPAIVIQNLVRDHHRQTWQR